MPLRFFYSNLFEQIGLDPFLFVFHQCVNFGMPIDFIYDLRTNTYDLAAYEDDAALLAKIRTGRNDAAFSFV